MDRYVYLKWGMWQLHAENLNARHTDVPRLKWEDDNQMDLNRRVRM
jgi:hypothetical protein